MQGDRSGTTEQRKNKAPRPLKVQAHRRVWHSLGSDYKESHRYAAFNIEGKLSKRRIRDVINRMCQIEYQVKKNKRGAESHRIPNHHGAE